MQGEDFNPLIVAVPIGLAALIILGYGMWLKTKQWRQEVERLKRVQNAHLPEGALYINAADQVDEQHRHVIGSFMIVAAGGFGLHTLQRLLVFLDQCGLERIVESMLVIESDSQDRVGFHVGIPPVFHDRVIYAFSDHFAGGFIGKPVAEVIERIDFWGVPILRATEELIGLHLRRSGNRAPSDIITLVSMGGHAPVALPALDLLHERFDQSLIVGFTALPPFTQLRYRFEEWKPEYERRGVRGWLMSDNLPGDSVTKDAGMVGLLVGLSDAALHADQAVQTNNALNLALAREPGAILIYQVVYDGVVGEEFRPDPSVAPRYYVYKQSVVERVLDALRRIERHKGLWSIDLPVKEKGTAIFDIVLVALNHDDLQQVEDEVNQGRKLRARFRVNGKGTNGRPLSRLSLFGSEDYGTPFASVTAIIDPQKPICPVVVIRLASVRNGARIVEEIVKPPANRSLRGNREPLLLPAGKRKRSPRNGHNGGRSKSGKEESNAITASSPDEIS